MRKVKEAGMYGAVDAQVDRLRPGWWIAWKGVLYQVVACDVCASLTVELEEKETKAIMTIAVEELVCGGKEPLEGPLWAPTLFALEQLLAQCQPELPTLADEAIAESLLQRADTMIHIVETIDAEVRHVERKGESDRGKQQKTTLRAMIQERCAQFPEPISLSTYYAYRQRYQRYGGDRAQIAASLHRQTWQKTRMVSAQLHFVDAIILRYYGRARPIRPLMLYRLAASVLHLRTKGLWVDPQKCGKQVPADLVDSLLDHRVPMDAILANPEKAGVLAPIQLPSRSWWYQYLRWFLAQPEHGRTVLTKRYGKGAWEQAYGVFDSFVQKATRPLQYVFADHYLLDVFVVDEKTRRRLDRLWLTVLIDAYSRGIVGMALLYEPPCIESIQTALWHAIWPKRSHRAYGIEEEWICYGIPQQLSLDNAWAHHSQSLERLARAIGQEGAYSAIDLVFRPPYKARYGALIERFFGNVSNQIKQLLPGAIAGSHPEQIRTAASRACLLYADLDRFLHRMIVEYQHTPHQGLGGMTPHQKWGEGMQGGLPLVPTRTEEMRRRFLRLYPQPRHVSHQGLSVFGLHYTSPLLSRKVHVNREGREIEYAIRYDPMDISTVAVFCGEQWMGDVWAKELCRADGTYEAMSLGALQMAKVLAKGEQTAPRNWLKYVNEVDELTKRRTQERRKTRRRDHDEHAGVDETNEKGVTPEPCEDIYTQLLADFQS